MKERVVGIVSGLVRVSNIDPVLVRQADGFIDSIAHRKHDAVDREFVILLDGDWCAEVIGRYLATNGTRPRTAMTDIIAKLQAILKERKSQPVDLDGLKVLEAVEKTHAGSPDAIGEFKFASNSDMLAHIEQGS